MEPEPDGLVRVLAFPLTSCVSSGKLPNHSVPWFPHLYNGDNNSINLIALLGILNELICIYMCVCKAPGIELET